MDQNTRTKNTIAMNQIMEWITIGNPIKPIAMNQQQQAMEMTIATKKLMEMTIATKKLMEMIIAMTIRNPMKPIVMNQQQAMEWMTRNTIAMDIQTTERTTTTGNHMTRNHIEMIIATTIHNIYHLISQILTSHNTHHMEK